MFLCGPPAPAMIPTTPFSASSIQLSPVPPPYPRVSEKLNEIYICCVLGWLCLSGPQPYYFDIVAIPHTFLLFIPVLSRSPHRPPIPPLYAGGNSPHHHCDLPPVPHPFTISPPKNTSVSYKIVCIANRWIKYLS